MSAKMTLEEIRSEYTRVRLLSEEDERAFVAKNFPRLLEIAQETRAELGAAEAAMRDMLAGWREIREKGGEDAIYGIGWDRAQKAVEGALSRIGTKK